MSLLEAEFSNDEHAIILALLVQLQDCRRCLSFVSEEQTALGLGRLTKHRLESSNTLKRGELGSWQQANQLLQSKLGQLNELGWEDILEVNSVLTGTNKNLVIRQSDIYIGPWRALEITQLKLYIEKFQKCILSNHKMNPLIRAALVHYWLVSLHPFNDGNGRTSVLIADALFASSGYLPQSFRSQLDALVGHFPERGNQVSPGRAVIKILNNVKRSYDFFK